MNNLINFISKTNKINGVSFVSIRGYESSSTGEVANHTINVGANLYVNAMAKDLKAMQNTSAKEIYFSLPNKDDYSFEVFQKAFNELYNSFVLTGGKNIDGTTKEQSKYSKGQANAYEKINNAIKVHTEKNRLYIHGLSVTKEVLVKGEYKETKKQAKTICKDVIKKIMDFKTLKFRNFVIEGADVLNLAKTSFEGANLSISL